MKWTAYYRENLLTVVDRSVRDISNGGSLDDVTDHKLLDRLVLGSAPDGMKEATNS